MNSTTTAGGFQAVVAHALQYLTFPTFTVPSASVSTQPATIMLNKTLAWIICMTHTIQHRFSDVWLLFHPHLIEAPPSAQQTVLPQFTLYANFDSGDSRYLHNSSYYSSASTHLVDRGTLVLPLDGEDVSVPLDATRLRALVWNLVIFCLLVALICALFARCCKARSRKSRPQTPPIPDDVAQFLNKLPSGLDPSASRPPCGGESVPSYPPNDSESTGGDNVAVGLPTDRESTGDEGTIPWPLHLSIPPEFDVVAAPPGPPSISGDGVSAPTISRPTATQVITFYPAVQTPPVLNPPTQPKNTLELVVIRVLLRMRTKALDRARSGLDAALQRERAQKESHKDEMKTKDSQVEAEKQKSAKAADLYAKTGHASVFQKRAADSEAKLEQEREQHEGRISVLEVQVTGLKGSLASKEEENSSEKQRNEKLQGRLNAAEQELEKQKSTNSKQALEIKQVRSEKESGETAAERQKRKDLERHISDKDAKNVELSGNLKAAADAFVQEKEGRADDAQRHDLAISDRDAKIGGLEGQLDTTKTTLTQERQGRVDEVKDYETTIIGYKLGEAQLFGIIASQKEQLRQHKRRDERNKSRSRKEKANLRQTQESSTRKLKKRHQGDISTKDAEIKDSNERLAAIEKARAEEKKVVQQAATVTPTLPNNDISSSGSNVTVQQPRSTPGRDVDMSETTTQSSPPAQKAFKFSGLGVSGVGFGFNTYAASSLPFSSPSPIFNSSPASKPTKSSMSASDSISIPRKPAPRQQGQTFDRSSETNVQTQSFGEDPSTTASPKTLAQRRMFTLTPKTTQDPAGPSESRRGPTGSGELQMKSKFQLYIKSPPQHQPNGTGPPGQVGSKLWQPPRPPAEGQPATFDPSKCHCCPSGRLEDGLCTNKECKSLPENGSAPADNNGHDTTPVDTTNANDSPQPPLNATLSGLLGNGRDRGSSEILSANDDMFELGGMASSDFSPGGIAPNGTSSNYTAPTAAPFSWCIECNGFWLGEDGCNNPGCKMFYQLQDSSNIEPSASSETSLAPPTQGDGGSYFDFSEYPAVNVDEGLGTALPSNDPTLYDPTDVSIDQGLDLTTPAVSDNPFSDPSTNYRGVCGCGYPLDNESRCWDFVCPHGQANWDNCDIFGDPQ